MNKVSRAVPWAVFDSLSTGLLGLLTLALLTRSLGAADFGAVTLVQSIVLLVQLVVGCGMTEAIIQRRPLTSLHHDSAFWAGLGMGVLGYLICLAAAGVYWISDPGSPVPRLLTVEGLACVFTGANLVPSALLDRGLQTRTIAKRTFIGKLTYCLAAITLAMTGFGVWSVIWAALLQNMVTTMILWSGHKRRPHLRCSWPHVRQLAAFGLPIMLEGVLWAFLTRVFNLLVGAFHGLEVLGYINVAIRAVDSICGVLTTVTGRISLPLFSSLQHDLARLTDSFRRGTEMITLLSLPALIGLMLTAPDWVPLLIGEKWITAVPLVSIACAGWIVFFIRVLAAPVLRAIGKPHAMLLPALLASLITIAGVFITADMSPIAVMLAWASRLVVTLPLGIIILRRHAGITLRGQLGPLASPVLCTLVMAGAVLGWRALLAASFPVGHVWSLASSVAIGALVYTAAGSFCYRHLLVQAITRLRAR